MSAARPRRERLAEALACVVGDPVSINGWVWVWNDAMRLEWSGDRVRLVEHDWVHWDEPLVITDPAEAWEALSTRLDLPGAIDDPRRAFQFVGGPPLGRVMGLTQSESVAWVQFADGVTVPRSSADDMPSAVFTSRCPLTALELAAPVSRGDMVALRRNGKVGPLVQEQSHPLTIADCVAFAADWPNVLTAEALARVVAAHFETPQFRKADQIVWRMGKTRPLTFRNGDDDHDAAVAEINARGYAVVNADEYRITLYCPSLE